MNISLFNRKYWVRRFGETKIVKGFITATHRDIVADIHVHASGNETQQVQPEGTRKLRHLEGHGMVPLVASDSNTGVKGDLLWYDEEWYECVSSVLYKTTLLGHYNYLFVLVPNDGSSEADTQNPPTTEPK